MSKKPIVNWDVLRNKQPKKQTAKKDWRDKWEQEQQKDMSFLVTYRDKIDNNQIATDDLLCELCENHRLWDAVRAMETYLDVDIQSIGLGCIMELLTEGGMSARRAKNAIRLHIGGEKGRILTSTIIVNKGKWRIYKGESDGMLGGI